MIAPDLLRRRHGRHRQETGRLERVSIPAIQLKPVDASMELPDFIADEENDGERERSMTGSFILCSRKKATSDF